MKPTPWLFKFFTLVSLIVGIVFFNFAQAHGPFFIGQRHGLFISKKISSMVSTSNPQAEQALSTVTPSVVSIYGYKNVSSNQEQQTIILPFFNISISVPASTETQQIDAGTGFFIDPRGYILTSEHVVSDPNASYTIVLQDGTQIDGTVLYRDTTNDIAILKISGSNFPAVTLGDSSKLALGETVEATGNALGSMQNVPAIGSVTGLDKTIQPTNTENDQQTISNLFQSSMQLYPGHSGGPTFDLSGNVVGINDAIAADQRNISFSVPINIAKADIQKVVPAQ